MLGLSLWEVSAEKTENLDERAVPLVGSYSTKTYHARSNPRRQTGTRTITSGLLGLPGLSPGTQLSLCLPYRYRSKDPSGWGGG